MDVSRAGKALTMATFAVAWVLIILAAAAAYADAGDRSAAALNRWVLLFVWTLGIPLFWSFRARRGARYLILPPPQDDRRGPRDVRELTWSLLVLGLGAAMTAVALVRYYLR